MRYFYLSAYILLFPINSTSAFSTAPEPIRINKVLKKTHSRRQADKLIAEGRLSVNNEPVHSAGQRVIPYRDVIRLDGQIVQGWETLNHSLQSDDERSSRQSTTTSQHYNSNNKASQQPVFEYIKYWKPIGVTCTTDRRIRDNLIDALLYDGSQFPHLPRGTVRQGYFRALTTIQ